MITSKELQYVDTFASKIPMPGEEYSMAVMKIIKECYDMYMEKYHGKEYNLIFSNGDEIAFEILSINLCHMLGIDYQNIKSPYFDNYRQTVLGIETTKFNSFDLLQAILEHAEKVVENDNDINNKKKIINYYKSQIKCSIFKKMGNFEEFNFAAINNPSVVNYPQSKKLFVPSNEAVCPYFFMGIKPEEEQITDTIKKYIVYTLLAPPDPKKFFENEEIIIPTQILISDDDQLKKVNATPQDRIRLLTMCKNILNTYGIPNYINIFGDYEAMLSALSSQDSSILTKHM